MCCRSRAQAIPLPDASASAAASPEAQAVEAIVPGLDFCNHSASPTCRWQVSADSRVRPPFAKGPHTFLSCHPADIIVGPGLSAPILPPFTAP